MQDTTKTVPVLIVGGGIVGLSSALFLLQHGLYYGDAGTRGSSYYSSDTGGVRIWVFVCFIMLVS